MHRCKLLLVGHLLAEGLSYESGQIEPLDSASFIAEHNVEELRVLAIAERRVKLLVISFVVVDSEGSLLRVDMLGRFGCFAFLLVLVDSDTFIEDGSVFLYFLVKTGEKYGLGVPVDVHLCIFRILRSFA